MLGKCANPDCHSQFRFLKDGTLYHVEATQCDTEPLRRVEHFWLCETCSLELTVISGAKGAPVVTARRGGASDRGHIGS